MKENAKRWLPFVSIVGLLLANLWTAVNQSVNHGRHQQKFEHLIESHVELKTNVKELQRSHEDLKNDVTRVKTKLGLSSLPESIIVVAGD